MKQVLTFVHTSLSLQTVFVAIPQLRLLQAAGLNFYGYEKPRVRVFCSECFWSRPGLSQCENLLVIDCYTPTGNVVRGGHKGFDQQGKTTGTSFLTYLLQVTPVIFCSRYFPLSQYVNISNTNPVLFPGQSFNEHKSVLL